MTQEYKKPDEPVMDAAFRISSMVASLPEVRSADKAKLDYYHLVLLERQVHAAESIAANLEHIANALGSRS